MTQETIGRYQIESEIGRGGMAAVYLANDPRFRRKVAIKLVSVSLQENPVFRERFEREAQLIARIEHPAIVPVYDFGEEDDRPYLVMRYMPGGALADMIKKGPLTFTQARSFISQIAPALDAVHAQDIVHRDLKPANILLDGFGNPAISDFGIAHFNLATVDLTGSAVIGTPAYMSPEQVRGQRDIDGRSDIYSLGVILFEMLAGNGPFRASTPLSVAMKHLTDAIPSIRSSRPDLPDELDRILSKALAKDRDKRYTTATELANDLQALIVNEKTESLVAQAVPMRAEDTPTEAYDIQVQGPASPDSVFGSQERISTPQPRLNPSAALPTVSDVQPGAINNSAKRPARTMAWVVTLGLAGIFVFFICGSLGIFGTWAGLSGLFNKPSPTLSPTSPPTLAPTPTETARETVLFADDFSDPNSGWPSGQDSFSIFGYQSNAYHILSNGVDSKPWVATERVYGDLSVYVDAQSISADPNGSYGLLCRIQDAQHFYYFVVTDAGAYTIGKYQNGEFKPFFPEGWQQSYDIVRGGETTHLRADCIGSTLRLYVNDALLAEVIDSDLTSGMVGMTAGSLNDQGYEVMFDNFRITQPGP